MTLPLHTSLLSGESFRQCLTKQGGAGADGILLALQQLTPGLGLHHAVSLAHGSGRHLRVFRLDERCQKRCQQQDG